VRYFERYDVEIDPGPEPDAREIAEQMVGAMRRAYETGEAQRVMLHTIRLGADLWRRYLVRFDSERGEVGVRVGPIVSTASPPSIPPFGGEVRVEVGVPLVQTTDEEVAVDIFSGPSFRFERRGDRLRVHFLDWHRRWSHSLTLATALGLGAAAVAALAGVLTQGGIAGGPLWVGLVVALGFVGHILEDQLGFMGSNLLHPFTRDRTAGLRLLHSGDAVPNFLTVWTAVMLILYNLDRFSAEPRLGPWWAFLGLGVALPVVVLGGATQWQRRRGEPEVREALRQREILSEAEGIDGGAVATES
jgi:membrane-bound metal-dependent hydrolase YbcI (DUF457 family)